MMRNILRIIEDAYETKIGVEYITQKGYFSIANALYILNWSRKIELVKINSEASEWPTCFDAYKQLHCLKKLFWYTVDRGSW